jgi:hypothetical protein
VPWLLAQLDAERQRAEKAERLYKSAQVDADKEYQLRCQSPCPVAYETMHQRAEQAERQRNTAVAEAVAVTEEWEGRAKAAEGALDRCTAELCAAEERWAKAERERDEWQETARQYAQNADHWRTERDAATALAGEMGAVLRQADWLLNVLVDIRLTEPAGEDEARRWAEYMAARDILLATPAAALALARREREQAVLALFREAARLNKEHAALAGEMHESWTGAQVCRAHDLAVKADQAEREAYAALAAHEPTDG